MSKGDAGKWAEKQVQDWLNSYSAAHSHMCFHRYPDARAARGALAAQPADFLVSIGLSSGQTWVSHLEVKETENTTRLPKSKIGQYGMLNKFHMTGWDTFILVYRSKLADWTFLNKADLFVWDEVPASFKLDRQSFATAAQALNWIYAK